jgi:ABC-type dipeptide/oligopeptide/nickel transport system permease subunit
MALIAMGVALVIGVYVGLGAPGMPGREDRIVSRARRLRQHTPLDWLRPPNVRR